MPAKSDPIAQILQACPAEFVPEVSIHATADTVTVTHVYDRAAYERIAAEQERRAAESARHIKDAFTDFASKES